MTAEAGSTAYTRRAVTVKDGFDAVPSVPYVRSVEITVATEVPDGAEAVAFPVGSDGTGASTLGIGVAALAAAGFDGRPGQSYVVAGDVPVRVAVGVGNAATIDADGIRDAAAAFGLATNRQARLAVRIPALEHVDAAAAAQVIVEGILLARYAYEPLKRAPGTTPVASITLVAEAGDRDDVTRGAERGRLFASAAMLSRDLANTPPAHLTAPRFGDIAERIGPAMGLEVELLDQAALLREGCGGILGVNGGSADEARLIKLTYRPKDDGGAHLALVAKGIMYDSGGISLKPSDAVHATMKNDMSGSAAVMGAMSILQALGCRTTVTGYLACTDNMPSGTALKLGDVITIHGGTTVEIMNTDAEGRLVMADALVMAAAEHPDAIVDIATLTGATMRALGTWIAGVMGNDEGVIAQVRAASDRTDERTWPFPLEGRYRRELDSEIADLKNMGGPNAGQITAGLFLEEFVDGTPWAHVDIAGVAMADPPGSWRPRGCTGFGARLLAELALEFMPPA
ncbi:MAG TPA: leucyl aminopeptidase [Candidatus Limnocylindrales bacterium]|jgi:leucyl aminopeptidase